MKKALSWILSATALTLGQGVAAQSNYPSKPIKIVVVTSPGTATDSSARFYAQLMSKELKTPFVIENKPGANTILATDLVARSPADGYTLLFTGSPFYVLKSLYKKLPFDPAKDIRMVARVSESQLAVVVPGNSPYKTFGELTEYMRAHPGKLNYSSAGNGSAAHMASAMVLAAAGVKGTHVPYKSSDLALTDTAGGQVDLTSAGISSVLGLAEAGRIRILAVTGLQRSQALPNVPTMAELGHKGFRVTSRLGVMAPAGVPDDVIDKLSTASLAVMRTKEFADFYKEKGIDPDIAGAAAYEADKQSEFDLWKKAVEVSGVQIE